MRNALVLIAACSFMLAIASIPKALCYPPAGYDYLDPTTALIRLEIEMLTETITTKVEGPTNVSRSNPYNPGDNRIKIDTEIVSMHLTGYNSHVGPITIIESPSKASTGAVQQLSAGKDFPASSFFDVYVEIQTSLPFPLNVLHNDDPVHMNTTIYHIPPSGAVYEAPVERKELKDQNNVIIGFILHVVHRIGTLVGGVVAPVDKLGLLVPYAAGVSVVAIAAGVATIRLKQTKKKK
jgi:hypothetical protein